MNYRREEFDSKQRQVKVQSSSFSLSGVTEDAAS
jgi:hypothetical protein